MGGIDITTAKKLQDFYFTLNPEIKKWQEDIQKQISKLGYIENIYGRRAWFVNKNDVTLLNKALAFKPQSTIGDSINRVIDNVVSSDTNIDMLLQVHDSGVFQYPISHAVYYRNHILDKSKLVLDYNGIKMQLPTDIKWSQVSYGDCK
jgi:DNA polymerase I-like protein with 3'-5' exonuclease and polymerase domains